MKVERRFYARDASILSDLYFPKATLREATLDAEQRLISTGRDHVVVQIVRVVSRDYLILRRPSPLFFVEDVT